MCVNIAGDQQPSETLNIHAVGNITEIRLFSFLILFHKAVGLDAFSRCRVIG